MIRFRSRGDLFATLTFPPRLHLGLFVCSFPSPPFLTSSVLIFLRFAQSYSSLHLFVPGVYKGAEPPYPRRGLHFSPEIKLLQAKFINKCPKRGPETPFWGPNTDICPDLIIFWLDLIWFGLNWGPGIPFCGPSFIFVVLRILCPRIWGPKGISIWNFYFEVPILFCCGFLVGNCILIRDLTQIWILMGGYSHLHYFGIF